MSSGQFPLASLEEEIAIKEASLTTGSNESEVALLTRCAEMLRAADIRGVGDTLVFVRAQTLTSSDHPVVAAYIAHPIRVARLALGLADKPDLEIVHVGLLHNIYEVCGFDEAGLARAGFSPRVTAAVRCLTIDRPRETEPEYLREFHDGMVAFGPPVPLVRVVDKLDNLLGLGILADGPVRDSYIDLAERFVLPLAEDVDGRLGRYFASVIAHVRAAGCRPEVRTHYERFVASTTCAREH